MKFHPSGKSLALLLCATLVWVHGASADTTMVAPRGVYATIDTRLTRETLQTFKAGSVADIRAAVQRIQAHPENYAPPVFYALSDVLFTAGDKDIAAFWFYAGQLRARFDANRCAQSDARQAVAALNGQYGPPINRYSFQDIPKLEALIPKVVAWDAKTPHHYDQRWINLHGLGALSSGLGPDKANGVQPTLSLPEDQWDAIAEKTRQDYLAGFKAAMEQVKARSK